MLGKRAVSLNGSGWSYKVPRLLLLIALLLITGCGSPAAQRTPTPVPTATPSGPYFSDITFAENVNDDGTLVNPTDSFPAGTGEIWAYFTYSSMQAGQSWGRLWRKDGEVFDDHTGQVWDKTLPASWLAYSLMDDPVLSGDYSLTLYIDGQPVREKHFYVAPLPTPTPDLNPAEFGAIQFASQVDEQGQPAQVLTAFNPGVKVLYGVFPFAHLKDGLPWKCEWLHNGEISATVDLEWNEGNTGLSYCTYSNDDDSPIEPGDYQMNLYISGSLASSGTTRVLAEASGSGDGLVERAPVDEDLLPVWNMLKASSQSSTQGLVYWATQNKIEVRLGETGGEIARYACPANGESGKILVSLPYLRAHAWEETAAAIARELYRAKAYTAFGSCVCRASVELSALQAQVTYLNEVGKLNRLESQWIGALDSKGQVDPNYFQDVLKRKDPHCQ